MGSRHGLHGRQEDVDDDSSGSSGEELVPPSPSSGSRRPEPPCWHDGNDDKLRRDMDAESSIQQDKITVAHSGGSIQEVDMVPDSLLQDVDMVPDSNELVGSMFRSKRGGGAPLSSSLRSNAMGDVESSGVHMRS